MVVFLKRQFQIAQTKFSFGATSAIITSLGLITGLRTFASPKLSIIGGLFIIAVADNIADSLGIHIYQESECLRTKEVWASTATNFITRFLVTLTFALLIIYLPIKIAVCVSIIWGMILLSMLSYFIARRMKKNPYLAIFEHLVIASLVILISNFLGGLFTSKFSSP
jgi:VIT1/CCC1 family predicted Fe2+/Mn2+ transporter